MSVIIGNHSYPYLSYLTWVKQLTFFLIFYWVVWIVPLAVAMWFWFLLYIYIIIIWMTADIIYWFTLLCFIDWLCWWMKCHEASAIRCWDVVLVIILSCTDYLSILCIGISYLEWKRNNNNNTNILFCYMCRGSTKYTTCVQKGYMMHHYLKERLVTISSLYN